MLPKTSASSTLQNKEIDFTDSKVPSTFNSVGVLALLIFEAKEAVLGYTLTSSFFSEYFVCSHSKVFHFEIITNF